MTTPTFTAAPANLPSRADPTTFAARRDPTLVWEKTLVDELVVAMPWVADQVVTVAAGSTAAAASIAAANYKGSWATLTGALDIPASVFHSAKVWMLVADIADVTASEPASDNADWLLITLAKATQVKAEAGTDNDDFMTSLRTAQAIAALGASGGTIPLLTQTVTTAVAAVDFTLSGGYENYMVVFNGVKPATDGARLISRLSTDGGSSFKSTSGDYSAKRPDESLNSTGEDYAEVRLGSGAIGSASNESSSGVVYVQNVSGFTMISGVTTGISNSGAFSRGVVGGVMNYTGANALRMTFSSGNIDEGQITLYGISEA